MIVTEPDSTDEQRREAFRAVAGQFASGVTVVIALRDGEPHATTASSFVAVSSEPPLIAVCFAESARMQLLLRESKRFTVSVLREEDHPLARRFARPDRPMGWSGLAGVALARRDPHPPVLEQAVAWFDCAQREILPLGDHLCFVGEVLAMERDGSAQPLLYYRGRFHRLGPPAAPPRWSTIDRTDLAADW
ncbi:MAG: flavin reductase family protein [Chloroflexota bacterium]|nr:flavin reductase family protein [Chloroflexota bacterium]